MDNLQIPSWDEYFMRQAYLVSSKSKDTRTKIGAILIRDKAIISQGYNGMPRGVNDGITTRYERPTKYAFMEHSERNCLYHCARHGISSLDTIMYSNGVPCQDCARGIIQAGIKEVVVHKQWQEWEQQLYWTKWIESAKFSKEMFDEAGIKITVFNGVLGIKSMLDGKIVEV